MYEMKGAWSCADRARAGVKGAKASLVHLPAVHLVACSSTGPPVGRAAMADPRRQAKARHPLGGNKPENTIAPFCVKTYHGFMTTWQALKRAGYMHPDSSLDAALVSNRCGVVAV